jgi:NlpC/P60 family putative phage cell wall peptidase
MTEDTAHAMASRIVREARSWIGTPYRHQGALKHAGADCLGLIRGVYRAVYASDPETPPPYSPDWAEASGDEAMAAAARRHLVAIGLDAMAAGDVALFRWREGHPAKHAGIITAPTTMVHAQSGASICEVSLCRWWMRRLAFAFRFPDIP